MVVASWLFIVDRGLFNKGFNSGPLSVSLGVGYIVKYIGKSESKYKI